jgi:hypothetical protein
MISSSAASLLNDNPKVWMNVLTVAEIVAVMTSVPKLDLKTHNGQ